MVDKDKSQEADKRAQYPYATWLKCVEIASAVNELGGSNTDVQKSVLAHRFRTDESAPSLLQNISSAKAFELIVGRGSYRLSELGKRYLMPTTPEEKRLALLEAVKKPIVFEKLIDRFDGKQLPAAQLLKHILQREHNVTNSWQPRVIALFMSTLKEAELIDADRYLRYKASLHNAGRGNMNGMQTTHATVVQPEPPPQGEPAQRMHRDEPVDVDADVSSFRIGKHFVRLETSHELSLAAWERLNRIVQALKPEGEASG